MAIETSTNSNARRKRCSRERRQIMPKREERHGLVCLLARLAFSETESEHLTQNRNSS